MKKYIAMGILAFTLAGCGSLTVESIQTKIEEVQSYTRLLCGFVPFATVVADILAKGSGDTVSTLGNLLCEAATTNPQSEGPGQRKPNTVYGVIVEGYWVK